MENKKEERCKFPAAVKAVIFDSNTDKYLVIKSTSKDKEFLEKYGSWEIPGGKLEEKESLEKGLLREITEEIGKVELEILQPLRARKVSFDRGEVVFIDFLAKFKGGKIVLSKEHEEYQWDSAEELIKNENYGDWLKDLILKAEEVLKSEKYLDGWKRCQADFENYKKRQNENQREMITFANANLIMEILPVLDNFYSSAEHIPEDQKNNPWVTGIMHIQRQLGQVLTDNGVKEIETKIGDDFNPTVHEAMQKVAGDKKKEGKILKVLQKGYEMNDRLIRPAKVVVE